MYFVYIHLCFIGAVEKCGDAVDFNDQLLLFFIDPASNKSADNNDNNDLVLYLLIYSWHQGLGARLFFHDNNKSFNILSSYRVIILVDIYPDVQLQGSVCFYVVCSNSCIF